MRFKRICALTAAMLSILILTGCWDMIDINKRVYVVGIGIDRKDDGYLFSFQSATPIGSDRAMDTNDVSYIVTEVEADTMAQAVQILGRNISHDVNFEHLSCIVIGDAAKDDFAPVLEYLYRNPSVRRQCMVAAAQSSAAELFGSDPESGNMSLTIASTLEKQDNSRISLCTTTLFKLYQAYSAGRGYTVFRVGDIVSDGDTPALSGANVYGRDGYTGSLDTEEAELIRLFFGRQSSGILSFEDAEGSKYSYEVKSSHCNKSCRIVDGIPSFKIEIEITCTPAELPRNHGILNDGQLAESIKSDLAAIIDRSKTELGAAPIGLEDTARQQCYRWYKEKKGDWELIYPRSAVELSVTCTIERMSSINDY